MPPEPWKVTASHCNSSYRVFNIRTDRARSPRTGLDHHFHVLESPPWVNVIPLTRQNEVVMIRQYRHGIQNVTLEIPGGLVEPGDTPEGAAKRELREETGYEGSEVILLGMVHPNPAIQNNDCYTYLIRNAVLAGRQEQDDKEDIEVVLHPLAEISCLIRENVITHSLVIAAFYRLFMEYLHYDLP
ncbi:MAG TPA: NUDIX hydrolase [Deltaproteobacteria bacterium]|nr:NUDIX hydrolase [Deltaproteobacteria bacterium]